MERQDVLRVFDVLKTAAADLSSHIAKVRADAEACLKPELLVCRNCDAEEDSLASALKKGWAELEHDDGANWDYLGLCPDCMRDELGGA